MPERVLILGGQRSGKSRHGEDLVVASGLARVYVATGTAPDAEMAARVAAHQQRRGAGWRTVEAPLALADAITRETGEGFHVLVDSLGAWVSNLMAENRDPAHEAARLIEALARASGPVVLVSDEVGLSLVPMNAVARQFVDALGTLNQQVAATVDRVVLVTAGLPLVLKAGQTQTEVTI